MRVNLPTVVSHGRNRKGPSDAWFAARTLEQSRAWLAAAENYQSCGFGTPKLTYIAMRMRQRIAEFEAMTKLPAICRCPA